MGRDQLYHRIVVKVGTATLTHDTGRLNLKLLDELTRVLSDLKNGGCEIVLVSSGAIAVGVSRLGMGQRPQELRLKQAAAAVGQCELIHIYDKLFAEYGHTVAQILLTGDDVNDDRLRQNLYNTFLSLLELGAVPVVNENDSVSFAEIERGTNGDKVFGDNDMLSAIVAALIGADALIILTDTDGLYRTDPKSDPDAELIAEVRQIDEAVKKMAGGAGTQRGTGGMVTKIEAAELATSQGIDVLIASGRRPEGIYDFCRNRGGAAQCRGTVFKGQRKAGEQA